MSWRAHELLVGLVLLAITAAGPLSPTVPADDVAWCGDSGECEHHTVEHSAGVPLHEPCLETGGCSTSIAHGGMNVADGATPAVLVPPADAVRLRDDPEQQDAHGRLAQTGPDRPPRVTS